MKSKILVVAIMLPLFIVLSAFQTGNPDPKDIIRKSEEKLNGKTAQGEMKMTIVRPTWTREMTMKSWSKGQDYSLVLITGPARDKGTAFLKRGKEMWNWQPSIDMEIKLPPSMMSQSWMGSDFTNDDLVSQTSIIDDFKHKLLGTESVDGRDCYKIELIPNEDAAVVWGKILMWIDKSEYLQLKTEFYDEDEYLVNTMLGKAIKEFDGKRLPSIMEVIPADEPGQKTIVEQISMEFDKEIKDNFFSLRNMKLVR